MSNKMKIIILYCKDSNSAKKWEIACSKIGLEYYSLDISLHNWLEIINRYKPDLILLKPPGDIEINKIMFDERIYILSQILKYKTFPLYQENIIYENKKMLSYYLDALGIPHPKTYVFYNKEEAIEYLYDAKYPVVMKSSIGASGTGVFICKSIKEANKYVDRAFSKKGIPMYIGPNKVTGNIKKWLKKAINNPNYAKQRISSYSIISKGRTKNIIIIQEYIPHGYEWRVIKIGESYFAHQKVKYKDKCSGTKGINYVNPPLELLDFVKEICAKNNLYSVAIDIFEYNNLYLVNEIQTIFGHVQDHILEVDGKPGRYLYNNNQWTFEEGNFNTNESYDLRLECALDLYSKGLL